MNLSISGRRALVLAATGGLGSAVCRSLAAEGAHIAVAGRNAARVAAARAIQTARSDETGARTNAELNGSALEAFATPDEPGRKLLMQAAEAMRLSARGYTRMLRVARTIADLAGVHEVGRIHVAEALSYRRQPPRA